MLLFYVPLALVVIYLNRLMPLEGGLYQWAKLGFNPFWGFLIAWNLWIYATVSAAGIVFAVPTDIGYMIGPAGAWVPASKVATIAITGRVVLAITMVAVYGLALGKILHNTGSIMILIAYVILLGLPVWALLRGSIHSYQPVPLERSSAELAQPGGVRSSVCGRAERIRICRDSRRRVTESGEEHRAIGYDIGSRDRADVHPGNQLRPDVCRQPADQSDWADSTNFSAGL